jgi:hypothetical protein
VNLICQGFTKVGYQPMGLSLSPFLFVYVLCACFYVSYIIFSVSLCLGFLCILHMNVLYHSILFFSAFFCSFFGFSEFVFGLSMHVFGLSLFLSFSFYVSFPFLFICFDSCLLYFIRIMCVCQQAKIKNKIKNDFQMFTNSPLNIDQWTTYLNLKLTNIETDRQTDGRTDRRTDRRTDE